MHFNQLTWLARTAAHIQIDLWTHHLLAYNTCAHITSPIRDQMVGPSYGAVERWGHRSSSKGFWLPSWAFSMHKSPQPWHMRLCAGERWTQRKDRSTGSRWECENTETQLPTVELYCKMYKMPSIALKELCTSCALFLPPKIQLFTPASPAATWSCLMPNVDSIHCLATHWQYNEYGGRGR